MLKKIIITISTKDTSVSSGYTVPQGKAFILTGVMARQRERGTHMNDGNYEWGYSRQLNRRQLERGNVYISNQLGSGFNHMIMHYSNNQYYEINNIKWKFFLEGETIFASMGSSLQSLEGGEVSILWEEIDNT